jgi:hypothetical protein
VTDQLPVAISSVVEAAQPVFQAKLITQANFYKPTALQYYGQQYLQAPQDHKEILVPQDQKEIRAILVLQDQKEIQEPQEPRAIREIQEHKVFQ